MPRTHRPALAAAALLMSAAAALTGCTATAPATTEPSTATSRPAPTATPTTAAPTAAIAAPEVVAPANSEAEAIRDANASLIGYYTASFESGHAGGNRLGLVTPWVTGDALQNERAVATYLQQKQYRLVGTPVRWTLNPSRSSATRTKAADGSVNRFGSVRLVGCATSTNHPVGDGAPAWTTEGQQFPRVWTVFYDPARKGWLVASAVRLSTSEEKAVACP